MRNLLLAALLLTLAGCMTSEPAPVPRAITVEATAPTAGYTLRVLAAHQKGDVLHVLSEATPPDGMAAQVLTPISTSISVTTNAKRTVHYVLGSTRLKVPHSGNNRYVIISDANAYDRAVMNAQPLPISRR